jgi:hypothetical protein
LKHILRGEMVLFIVKEARTIKKLEVFRITEISEEKLWFWSIWDLLKIRNKAGEPLA